MKLRTQTWVLVSRLAGWWIAASLLGCTLQGYPAPPEAPRPAEQVESQPPSPKPAIKKVHLEEPGLAERLEALYAAQSAQGRVSCELLQDLAVVVLMKEPLDTQKADRYLEALAKDCIEEMNPASPWLALVRLWEKDREMLGSKTKKLNKTQGTLAKQAQEIQSLKEEVSNLQFQLEKIKEIHRQTEEKRLLSP